MKQGKIRRRIISASGTARFSNDLLILTRQLPWQTSALISTEAVLALMRGSRSVSRVDSQLYHKPEMLIIRAYHNADEIYHYPAFAIEDLMLSSLKVDSKVTLAAGAAVRLARD